jgi:hypothetical protein
MGTKHSICKPAHAVVTPRPKSAIPTASNFVIRLVMISLPCERSPVLPAYSSWPAVSQRAKKPMACLKGRHDRCPPRIERSARVSRASIIDSRLGKTSHDSDCAKYSGFKPDRRVPRTAVPRPKTSQLGSHHEVRGLWSAIMGACKQKSWN